MCLAFGEMKINMEALFVWNWWLKNRWMWILRGHYVLCSNFQVLLNKHKESLDIPGISMCKIGKNKLQLFSLDAYFSSFRWMLLRAALGFKLAYHRIFDLNKKVDQRLDIFMDIVSMHFNESFPIKSLSWDR